MKRQFSSKQRHTWMQNTIVAVAKVLLERPITCCEVDIVVSGVVRVCHVDGL